MFIRVFRPNSNKEILINTSAIWKIEVTNGVPGPNMNAFAARPDEGADNPSAVRVYKVFAGDEAFAVTANPNDPVTKVLDQIYKNAVRGEESPDSAR
jgi:hypothetical protein